MCAPAHGSDLSTSGQNHSFAQLLRVLTRGSTQLSLQTTMGWAKEGGPTRQTEKKEPVRYNAQMCSVMKPMQGHNSRNRELLIDLHQNLCSFT